ADTMRAFYTMLHGGTKMLGGGSDMMAYLARMSLRLVEMHRVLTPTGSLFLHCDPTASHYLKLLLDSIFGAKHFRNEIAWCYWGPGSPGQRQFSRKHDVILWYSVGPTWTFNADAVRIAHADKTVENYKAGLVGSGFAAGDSAAVRALDTGGKIPEDWWSIAIAPRGKEYLGYPTQKPIKLLERIVLAASNPGDLVLDPFCGCGTTIDAAQELGRRWIGVDVTHLAVGLIKHRLADRYGPEIADSYKVVGEPTTIDDARVLATDDRFQFQAWALGLVGARIAGSDKKGGDKGIDGRLYFHDSPTGPTRQIMLSVKAGHLVPSFVRDLRGVMEREQAEIGVLISFEEPTAGMRAEAAEAGFYVSGEDGRLKENPWGQKYPRIQLLTVRELLDGRGIEYPHITGANVTLRRAQRARDAVPEKIELFAAEEPAEYGD
ncbi:MAG: site-specific DNA-methyltransferase, partial [Actinomycetota bacterium]|nr:site-specific DNA-methyltransferase [Actinomycetota bacterium]